MLSGAVPVTIRPPHPQNLSTTLPTVRMIVEVSKASVILSNQNVIKLLKSKVCPFNSSQWGTTMTFIYGMIARFNRKPEV